MKNMKISAKLILSFLIITSFSVILAVIGIWSGVSINGNYTYLLEEPVEQQNCLKEMQLQFTMMRYRTANFVMEVENPDIISGTLIPQYQSAHSAFVESLNNYSKYCENDSRREPSVIQKDKDNAVKLGNLMGQFKQSADNTLALVQAGDAATATTTLRDAISIANEVNTLLGTMISDSVAYVNGSSGDMDVTANTLTIILVSVTVVCVISSIIFALYISGQISKPLIALTGFMNKAKVSGDITLRPEDVEIIGKYAVNKDETGQVIGSTAEFVKRLVNVAQTLEAVADGNLTAELDLLSNQDMMGLSLKKMTENLNGMFSEIQASTAQVSTGSKQIADGAQSLAQGSTEQASTVEQLSNSVTEIARKTKANAELADKAAKLADAIKGNAEKGNRQMEEMMLAVKEINQASQSINKVIKVIDDIAFQTNILALNAAVEAARAGQHGKGFAVVAEEVRSLAAKSAEAAKDTGGLIANSIEKAELGTRIADETAASLNEIVTGINESTQLFGEIARSSEEQSDGIAQINRGIEQVALVVQQNSATAEESAAASQEMSGQAALLEGLVEQFKLRDGAAGGFIHGGSSVRDSHRPLSMPAKSSSSYRDDNGDYGKY